MPCDAILCWGERIASSFDTEVGAEGETAATLCSEVRVVFSDAVSSSAIAPLTYTSMLFGTEIGAEGETTVSGGERSSSSPPLGAPLSSSGPEAEAACARARGAAGSGRTTRAGDDPLP